MSGMNLREAAQAALEALEALQGGCTDHDDGTVEAITVWCPEVVEDLRAALAAEPAQPLTDEQIRRLMDRMDNTHDSDLLKFAREVERAHGIGGEQ